MTERIRKTKNRFGTFRDKRSCLPFDEIFNVETNLKKNKKGLNRQYYGRLLVGRRMELKDVRATKSGGGSVGGRQEQRRVPKRN